MALPLVAIVGAPNVGKSTLFNRLVRRRRAIVTDEPGVTRDRLYGEVDDPCAFRVVDTGGLTPNTEVPFAEEIERQALIALEQAAVVLFVVDGRAGVTAIDRDVAALLRRADRPILLVVNKIDSPKNESDLIDFFALGLGEPFPVSAEHGIGVGELLDSVCGALAAAAVEREPQEAPAEGSPINVAIVGRPNVGKSSLLNRLLGEERALVSEIPGTTRDSLDTILEVASRRYRLIDTAGIRRRGKVQLKVEKFSVARARQNVAGCDVAVLVVDATEPFAAQDAHVAGMVADAWKPLVVAVNKWDVVEEREARAREWTRTLEERLKFVRGVPVVLVSALSGQRVTKILERVEEVYARASIRVPTPEINRWLHEEAGGSRGRPVDRRSLRLFYATQTGIRPPRFLVFCNDPSLAHFSVRRRMANSLRERFGLGAVPVRIDFRSRAGKS